MGKHLLIKLEIILPFRDAATTLDPCLDSIRQQTFRDFRLLAINDHSRDDSCSVVQQHANCDKRIRLLHNPHPGLVNALNFGLMQATSPLIARMDADDLMDQQRLQLQLDYLQQNKIITLVGCQVRLFPKNLIHAGYREYVRWQNQCLDPDEIAADIYIESPFAHPSVMFRRKAIIETGGYREGMFPEDYDLWFRLHRAGHRMAKLPQILLDWRESENRTSRQDPRCSREAFDWLRAHYLARDPLLLARRDELVIWGAGRKTRKRCQRLLEQGFQVKAWIDIDPRKIGNRLQGVPVVSPEWLLQESKPFVLVYVTNHGARDLIRQELEDMGYRRRVDYLMVG
ncbi:glycosyl transferase [bacterium endosymbiont of Escarpia laminata]|nr:MAG: glycosyl transferase [bacterium endosymbiont of Escarpia laminata]